MVDDELYSLFGKFEQGVRILVLSDSCHSGTLTRAADYKRLTSVTRDLLKDTGSGGETPMFRAIPKDIQEKTYEKNKDYYSNIQKTYPAGERVAIGASVILLSGCQDNQLSADGLRNGLFTGTLRKVWNEGKLFYELYSTKSKLFSMQNRCKSFLLSIPKVNLKDMFLYLIEQEFITIRPNKGKCVFKKRGLDALSEPTKTTAGNLINKVKDYGIFIVPVGTVEQWLQSLNIQQQGKGWLIEILSELQKYSNEDMHGDDWQFILDINKWVTDPNRLGMNNTA